MRIKNIGIILTLIGIGIGIINFLFVKPIKFIFIVPGIFFLITGIVFLAIQEKKSGCNPKCDQGYDCINGDCVKSGCNPKCDQGYDCINGNCVKTTNIEGIKKIFNDIGIQSIYDISSRTAGGCNGFNSSDELPNIWKGYVIEDFWECLEVVSKLDENPLYLGKNSMEGIVIISGMLANFLQEGYNLQVCDETVWDQDCHGPCSCGQFGNNYNGPLYTGEPSCKIDKNMKIDTSTNGNNAKWGKGSMKCEPGGSSEGCCWWGRGPTQLTGVHNIKLFELWLTKNEKFVGKLQTQLCNNPGIICVPHSKTDKNLSVVWLSSLFYWIEIVQTSPEYISQLEKFMSMFNNGKFPILKTTDLMSIEPAMWPSGVCGVINRGNWSNSADKNEDRLCQFVRLLKLTNLMENGNKNTCPDCDTNKKIQPLPPLKNCCSCDGTTCMTGWCNESKEKCSSCNCKWYD